MGTVWCRGSQLTDTCLFFAAAVRCAVFAAAVRMRGAGCRAPAWAGRVRLKARLAAIPTAARIRRVLRETWVVLALRAIQHAPPKCGEQGMELWPAGPESSARHHPDSQALA